MTNSKDTFHRSWIEVDLIRFRDNVNNILNKLPEGVKYLQVVKADAYGHGAVEIAKVALKLGASHLGVANAAEGLLLRESGITSPIIILGPSLADEIPDIIGYDLIPSISSRDFAIELSEQSNDKPLTIHIEVDTGMGRGGFNISNISEISSLFEIDGIYVEGVFSHFPMAEETGDEYTLDQIERFNNLLQSLRSSGFNIPLVHMANSGGYLNYPQSLFSMVRIGLLSYGYYPDGKKGAAEVSPVMSFKSRISLIKHYCEGESISYGRTFITRRATSIAVVPVGYADGYFRAGSNSGFVIISGQKFPIVGRVSMDMIMADITDALIPISAGDIVTILGRDGSESLDADDLAALAGTINYEILTNAGRRAVRVYNKAAEKKTHPRELPSVIRELEFPSLLKKVYGIDLDRIMKRSVREDMIKKLFGSSWDLIREDFSYAVELHPHNEELWRVRSRISFKKWISTSVLKIGLASDPEILSEMVHDREFIYRWLLQKDTLSTEDMKILSFNIDGIELEPFESDCSASRHIHSYTISNEVRNLSLIYMEIESYYPRNVSAFPVYFTDFTKGGRVKFSLPAKHISYLPFISMDRPITSEKTDKGTIELIITGDDYILPENGIIFYWER